jgi:hypothetical protein
MRHAYDGNTHEVLAETAKETRPLGRPKCMWEVDNIKPEIRDTGQEAV